MGKAWSIAKKHGIGFVLGYVAGAGIEYATGHLGKVKGFFFGPRADAGAEVIAQ